MTMSPSGRTASVVHMDRLELAFAPKPWAFAVERRAEIDAYFAKLRKRIRRLEWPCC